MPIIAKSPPNAPRSLMRACPNCASVDLVQIDMQLNGGPARFSHCHRCEHRWWAGGAGGTAPLPLGQVLDMARKPAKSAKSKADG